MCEPKPITKDEVCRTLRLLALRMDATAQGEPKAETLAEAAEQFGWAVAIDRILAAMDAVK